MSLTLTRTISLLIKNRLPGCMPPFLFLHLTLPPNFPLPFPAFLPPFLTSFSTPFLISLLPSFLTLYSTSPSPHIYPSLSFFHLFLLPSFPLSRWRFSRVIRVYIEIDPRSREVRRGRTRGQQQCDIFHVRIH